MARVKDSTNIFKATDTAKFDKIYKPGEKTEYAGIYRCTGCGDEIGMAKDRELPPQNEDQHKPPCKGDKIRWKLLVQAEQR